MLPTALGGVGLPDISLKIATAKLIDYRNMLCDKNDLEYFLILLLNDITRDNIFSRFKIENELGKKVTLVLFILIVLNFLIDAILLSLLFSRLLDTLLGNEVSLVL